MQIFHNFYKNSFQIHHFQKSDNPCPLFSKVRLKPLFSRQKPPSTDCYDGSDEATELCTQTICPIEYAKCYDGACILRELKCNGIRDCVDGSDERNCGHKWNSCAPAEFHCGESAPDSRRFCIDRSRICDGRADCPNGSDENKTLCENPLCPKGTFRCRYGGCIFKEVLCDGFTDCFDGSDESANLCIHLKCPECIKSATCRPLHANNVAAQRLDMRCTWNGRVVSCSDNISPGTEVSYACMDHFLPASPKDAANDWNVCQADGTWLREPLKCKPDCGRPRERIPSTATGWQVGKTLPWHATIYHLADGDEAAAELICGGTLISETVVATAARCLWNVTLSNLRVSLANSMAAYNHADDFTARQYRVEAVALHPSYYDRLGNFGSDIGLIELDEPVELGKSVAPVCIGSDSTELDADVIGLITGLGVMENGTIGERISVAAMPVVPQRQCVDTFRTEFRKYLPFGTMCAGRLNGSHVCNGDNGAGLVVPVNGDGGRYYLHGIVSLAAQQLMGGRCDAQQLTVLTKVGVYVEWIEAHLDRISQRPV